MFGTFFQFRGLKLISKPLDTVVGLSSGKKAFITNSFPTRFVFILLKTGSTQSIGDFSLLLVTLVHSN